MNTTWLWWIAFATVFLLYHLFAYIGHFGYDDLQYAELAANLANGQTDWNDHFSFRWVITGLTALSYKLFGVSDFASSLPALIVTLATLGLIFNILGKYSLPALITGLALFTFNHWTLFYSDKLMPDVYVAFFCTASVLIYYNTFQHPGKIIRPFLFAFMLMGAFLSKETVVLMVPLLFWWMIRDFAGKQNRSFWIYSGITGLVLLLGYFISVGFLTGNPLERFRALIDNQYSSFCDYAGQPIRELVKRITYGLLRELTHQGMMTGFVLCLPALILNRGSNKNKTLHFFTVTSVLLFLSSDFMTISPAAYNPMCTDPRHYLFLIPVFSVAGGLAFFTFYADKRYWFLVLGTTALFALLLVPLKSRTIYELMLPLAVVSITGIVISKSRYSLQIGTLFLVLILTIKPAGFISYARKVDYKGQREFVIHAMQTGSYDRIITDEVQKRLLRYYHGFRKPLPEIENWQEADESNDTTNTRIALLINPYTGYLSGDLPGKMPFFATHPDMISRKVDEDPVLKIAIYTTDKWQKTAVLASFRHGFETKHLLWSGGDSSTDSVRAFHGKYCDRPGEYSSTFRLPADSLPLSKYHHLLITCRMQFLTMQKTKASLIVSVGNNQGNDLWVPCELFPQVKSLGTWNPVTIHTMIEVPKIKPGSEIVIYLWNLTKEEVYVDDWEITFSAL